MLVTIIFSISHNCFKRPLIYNRLKLGLGGIDLNCLISGMYMNLTVFGCLINACTDHPLESQFNN